MENDYKKVECCGSLEIPKDLEEAAKHHSEQYRPHWPNQVRPAYDSFIAGAKWDRERLMKEAVECELVCIKDCLAAILPMKEFQWTVGDKVRVIVIPNTDKK